MKAALTILFAILALPALAGLLEDMGIDSDASRRAANYELNPPPPPAPPAQHSGAEGLGPLPLPVVPLRRTEKKNPPRPPVLVAKLATGDKNDWANNPSDVDNLLKWMAGELNQNFSTINMPADQVPASPTDIPVLYRSGQKAFQFTPELRQRLRAYLMNGGTLILDSCCGSGEFAVSAMREIQQLIPERTPYRLSLDHPVYHAYYDINAIKFRPYAKEAAARDNTPSIIGIDINTRTAVFFFRYDISSGWQGRPDTDDIKVVGYSMETAKLLGANLMAYITTERNAAVPLSRALSYVNEDDTAAGKFTFAQGKYNGLWKTREAGLNMLLNAFHEKTTTPVRFETIEVPLDSPKIFDAPYVYVTGTIDFRWTPEERANLRKYLSRGGILFAEAGCGRPTFDMAFRQEMLKILPDAKLEPLDPDHLIFRFPNNIQSVTPRPALARALNVQGALPPRLEGIALNGQLAVIYSPFDLAGGWELAQAPYDLGIEPQDALALGVNILSYIITQ